MGVESNSAPPPPPTSSSSTPSPSGKRARDPEDEVYLDNFHSHKRYLSEIMASSLNGLTVGEPLSENLMDSPARDEMSWQYSPMSEDSDDCRFCETSTNLFPSQSDSSVPTSPVSPYRYQRPFSGMAPSNGTNTSLGCSTSPVTSLQPHQRGSDSEGRFPSSPSDICHSADLRRAALLRSVQMRAQPAGPSSMELPYCSMPEPGPNIEAEDRPCSCIKSLVDERVYQLEECSSMGLGVSESEYNEQKSCKDLNRDMKDSQSGG
ncbi:uncharacterized protein LOC103494744 isoform X2 [Cucumis melo]|uniref:Uncharacterized protein LOC103494744 isoform X2 n=1 Tax=Cucumis melo TaxID=3656 RepID=A0A1S3BYE6_CUCME|nr:uncharacterized protein LOC103494744 isoform X2 [Cucumis melo]